MKSSTKQNTPLESTETTHSIQGPHYCSQPYSRPRVFSPDVGPVREGLILKMDKKWANGTVIHYYFFDSPKRWRGSNAEKAVVRKAFKQWKDVGIGLEFAEVDTPSEAEIRIGFQAGDGSWSYVGRDVLEIGTDKRTMNFGWDITQAGGIDTAIHEVGHSLGFSHEHQNPNAGIVWDEEAVYKALEGAPNFWSRKQTHYNIIRKLSSTEVEGSEWDPNSIMHYPFDPGLILTPEDYGKNGLYPTPGLSDTDIETVRKIYPALAKKDYSILHPLKSQRLTLASGEQKNFLIEPKESRKYRMATFGESDSLLVLFEQINGDWRYLSADDDSGFNRNASLHLKLFKDRVYCLRVRSFFAHQHENVCLLLW